MGHLPPRYLLTDATAGIRAHQNPFSQCLIVGNLSARRILINDDRVFGVSFNGEHRAYPLRILNAHEMANDVVGGVPFALAY